MKKIIVKKIFFYSIMLSLYWSIVVTWQVNQAVTNYLNWGRFGDKIVSYTTAKWVSYKFNIPLFFKPFEYSSVLRCGKEEKKYSKEIAKKFKEVIVSNEQDIIKYEKEDNIIFESKGWFFISSSPGIESTIEYMLKDQYFAAELKNMLQPVVPLPQIELSQDKVTVAVHIRKGNGFDKPLNSIQYYNIKLGKFADEIWPLKFSPEQYYVDQIKRVSMLFDGVPLFIHIFTDDRNPLKLVNRIKKAVNKKNITFSCRQSDNAHVIEDFYNMSRFDCLIRSGSHFAIAAQLLGNHKIIIYPKHCKWVGRKLIIDEISIIDNRAD